MSRASLLSNSRGAAAREAHVGPRAGKHGLLDVLEVLGHRHDVPLRPTLTALGYRGVCRPPIPPPPRREVVGG
jgi:hypothetical protein